MQQLTLIRLSFVGWWWRHHLLFGVSNKHTTEIVHVPKGIWDVFWRLDLLISTSRKSFGHLPFVCGTALGPLPFSHTDIMTTSNRMFSLFSFLSFVLCCIPFPRYMQGKDLFDGIQLYELTNYVRVSLEYRNLPSYSLEWPRLSDLFHQLHRLEL